MQCPPFFLSLEDRYEVKVANVTLHNVLPCVCHAVRSGTPLTEEPTAMLLHYGETRSMLFIFVQLCATLCDRDCTPVNILLTPSHASEEVPLKPLFF